MDRFGGVGFAPGPRLSWSLDDRFDRLSRVVVQRPRESQTTIQVGSHDNGRLRMEAPSGLTNCLIGYIVELLKGSEFRYRVGDLTQDLSGERGMLETRQESGATMARPVRKWLRWAGSALMAACFTAGIVFLMMWLAGVFQPKVPAVARERSREVPGESLVGEVRLVRRPRMESAVATVRPVQEVAVASKLLARVNEVRVKAGQAVQQGEVLVVLDDADLQSRRKQAQAAEASAQAKLEQARIDFERGKRLQAKQAIPQADFDKMSTEFRGATADVERARQAVHEAEILLDYATVRATIAGTMSTRR